MSLATLEINDFSKGLDLRSSINSVAPGFTPNARNMVMAEYGGVEKVRGYSTFATAAQAPIIMYPYEKSDGVYRRIVVATTNEWGAVTSSGTYSTVRPAMSAATNTRFVTYADTLYGLDEANDLASWNGTTLTTYTPGVNTGPPRGLLLGIWQGRMFVSPAITPRRIQWSEPHTFTGTNAWPANNYVDIAPPGAGATITGGVVLNDRLVVFTHSSVFQLYDPKAGAHAVIDSSAGTPHGLSLAVIDGVIYGVNERGVFTTTGQSPLEYVSELIDPLFRPGQFSQAQPIIGVAFNGRYMLCGARGSVKDLTLIYYPDYGGAWMALDYPMNRAVVSKTYDGSPRLFFADSGGTQNTIRLAFNGGTFDGAAIKAWYTTPFFNLGDEAHAKRLRKVRVVGRGEIVVGVRTEYREVDDVAERLLFPTGAAGVWDTAVWDAAFWGGYELSEGWARFRAVSPRGRQFQLMLTESSSGVSTSRNVLDRTGEVAGAAAIHQLEPHFASTGRLTPGAYA